MSYLGLLQHFQQVKDLRCFVQVFVTCGTADKRAFLLEAFPKLRDDHIGDSRSCSFEETVKRRTAGKGVHLALNSLADDKLQVRVTCLGILCFILSLPAQPACVVHQGHCPLHNLLTGLTQVFCRVHQL